MAQKIVKDVDVQYTAMHQTLVKGILDRAMSVESQSEPNVVTTDPAEKTVGIGLAPAENITQGQDESAVEHVGPSERERELGNCQGVHSVSQQGDQTAHEDGTNCFDSSRKQRFNSILTPWLRSL